MYYNEENNAVFETKESYDMYVKAPRDVKSVIDECNVNMHHDIDVVKQEKVKYLSEKISSYYKTNKSCQDIIIKQMNTLIDAYTNYWISIVNKYKKIFLINSNEGCSKDCLKALKKVGVPHIDINDLLSYAVDIEFIVKKYKDEINSVA